MPPKQQLALAQDIECEFLRVPLSLQPAPLGHGKIVGVVFQNTLTNEDGTGNNLEAMVGRNTGQPWNLLPGQESPIIYAHDLSEIYARTRVAVMGDSTFNVTVLVYRQRPA